MNRVTVARHLDVLMASGRVEMIPFGQAKVFYLSQRVPMLSLVNCFSDIVLVVDDRMKIRQCNTAFLKLFGGVAEDYYGMPVQDVFLSDDDGNHLFRSLDMALRGKNTTEEIGVRRGEERIDLKVAMYPCIFENGERSVSILMTDITGLKRNEERTRINTEMVRQMSSIDSPDEIFILGADTAKMALRADASAIFLMDGVGRFLYQYSTGEDGIFRNNFNDILKGCDLCERIIHGKPVFYSKSGSDDGKKNVPRISSSCSLSAYPLFRRTGVAGFIAVTSFKNYEISDFEKKELELISCQISCALSMEDVFKK